MYELFTADHQREPVVREAVWLRSADLSRVHQEVGRSKKVVTFRPTVRVRDAPVPAEHLAALLSEATTFRLPITWFSNAEAVTSDTGGRGFEFYSRDQPPAALKLEWSYDTPLDWEQVVDWYGRLEQFLAGCLPSAAGQG